MAQGAGTKAERDALRRTMQQHGYPPEEIAAEIARRGNYRPRTAWRHVHGWSQREAAARYNEAASDPNGTMSGNRISEYELWPHGGNKPSLKVLFVLAQIYGTTPAALIDLADREMLNADERVALTSPTPPVQRTDAAKAAQQAREPVLPPSAAPVALPYASLRLTHDHEPITATFWTPYAEPWNSKAARERLIMESANESFNHAARAQSTDVGSMTLDQLRDDIVRLARVSGVRDILPFFPEMIATRNKIYTLLDGRHHPRQTTDLYFLASAICCVLADASDCLGYRNAAMTHSRAALTYAEIIGNNSLQIWCRTEQAALARQDDRPHHAANFAQAAQPLVHNKTSRAWIYGVEGQALALTGNNTQAMEAFATAKEAIAEDFEHDEVFDDIGGIFQYSRAKLHRAMASAYIQSGQGEPAAEAANAGIAVFEETSSGERDFASEASLRIKLANAHVLSGQLDSARDALAPVLSLPLNHRYAWLGDDIKRLRRTLAALPDQRSTEFIALQDGAEDFVSTLISEALPGEPLS